MSAGGAGEGARAGAVTPLVLSHPPSGSLSHDVAALAALAAGPASSLFKSARKEAADRAPLILVAIRVDMSHKILYTDAGGPRKVFDEKLSARGILRHDVASSEERGECIAALCNSRHGRRQENGNGCGARSWRRASLSRKQLRISIGLGS